MSLASSIVAGVKGSAKFAGKTSAGLGRGIIGVTKGVATKSGALDLGLKVGLGVMGVSIGLGVANSKLETPVNVRKQKLDQIQKFSSQLDRTYR